MSVLGTAKTLLEEAVSSSNRRSGAEQSRGAYWCNECGERILDLDVEGDEPPACRSCGEEMVFERSIGRDGCAC